MRLSLLLLPLLACAPSLEAEYPPPDLDSGPKVTFGEPSASGARSALLDASNRTAEVFLDLAGNKGVSLGEVVAGAPWDLSFKRVEIALNPAAPSGGLSQVSGVAIPGGNFAELAAAPADGWQHEADGQRRVFSATGQEWWLYDLGTHQVEPRPQLYAVRTRTGPVVLLQIQAYYHPESRTAGVFTIQYRPLPSP